MTSYTQTWGILALLTLSVAGGLLGTGCTSVGETGSGTFAAVTIAGHTGEQIRSTAVTVFRENGYRSRPSAGILVFEKTGSVANTISRDGLIAAQAGERSIIRVRAEVVDLDAGSSRLQCQAYLVSGAGDSFFEEEHRLTQMRRGPYQDILDEVAKRLKQP